MPTAGTHALAANPGMAHPTGMVDEPVTNRPRLFLLFFYWKDRPPADAEEWRERDSAFDSWARAVETRGELVVSERVLPGVPVAWLGGADGRELPPDQRPGTPAGFDRVCVVRTRDREAALELARRAPHLEGGGFVSVHELEDDQRS